MAYNPNFQWKRKTVTITKGTDLPVGYQVKLTIVRSTDAPEAQADFRDLRFETTTGYGLSHWIESVVAGTATVWVKLKDALTDPTVSIYMYYGDPYVSSASNGTNTFDFFDDFDSYPDGNLNGLGGWTGNTDYKVQSVIAYKGKAIRSTLAITDVISHSITPIDKGIFSVYMRLDSYESMSTYLSSGATKTYEVLLYANPANVVYLSTTNPVTDFSPSVPRNYNQWYKIDIAFDTVADQYAYIKVDNSIKVTNAATISGGNIDKITLGRGGTAAGCNWDIVVLRKYVTTEPSTPTIGATATIVNWNPQRKKINITGTTPADYQIKLTVTHAMEMNVDYSDLRFVSSDNTALNYWIESYTPNEAIVWVKIPAITGSGYVYMHYGNPNLTSVSNGTNTFAMFDDFSSDVFTDIGTGFGTANGRFEFSSNRNTANDLSYRNISIASGDNIEAKFKVNITSSATNAIIFIGFSDTTTQYNIYTTNGFGLWLQGQGGIIQTYLTKRESNVETNSLVYNINFSTDYIVKLRRNGSNVTYELWNSSESSLLSTLTNTITGVAYSNFKIADYDGDEAGGYTMVGIVDNLSIRKYVSSEPTIGYADAPVTMNTFSNRKTITINNNSGGALTDYQVPITVVQSSFMQTDFDDIRFVDSSGNLLPYWIESITGTYPNQTAKVWIKANLPTGDNTVYMYYGNADLTSASDGNNVFDFFDDFSGSSIDTSKWIYYGGAHIENGNLKADGGNLMAIRSIRSDFVTGRMDLRFQKSVASGNGAYFGFRSNCCPYTGVGYWMQNYNGSTIVLNRYNGGTAEIQSVAYTWTTDWVNASFICSGDPGTAGIIKIGIASGDVTSFQINYSDSSMLSSGSVGLGNYFGSYNITLYDNVRVRKYIVNESTAITVSTGLEQTPVGITADSMTISKSENPCRTGFCTVTVDVTWTNGSLIPESFIPSIKINGTPAVVTPALTSVTVDPSGTKSQQFIIPNLPANTYSICPDPN